MTPIENLLRAFTQARIFVISEVGRGPVRLKVEGELKAHCEAVGVEYEREKFFDDVDLEMLTCEEEIQEHD